MLSNKTIFITGATAGFGLACAKLFISHGAKVIATGRRKERLDALRAESSSIHAIALDVRDRAAVESAISQLPEPFSAVDILINNAGLALGLGSYEQQPPDDLEQMVDTNIKGVMHCTHALLPGMLARNYGHIVNLSSIAGTYPYPGGNVYGATKAFITQFSLNLRADLLGKNIRVTNIEPGMCDTEFSTVRFHGDKAKADSIYAGMKPLSAEDIAQTIFWTITQPEHVNINRVEIMPVMQAFSAFAVNRKS
ncbi:MAG: SDR family oxidoreductase [Rickettsiales bacterium]|jgi:3-hydroxy acid dehydrogenase/malonic semialdehyde reductase|nr:SDR family oxidoreductase [Rickettsiales bacterium]